MAYYDPLAGRRVPSIQTAPMIAGAGSQFAQSPTVMGGQTLGATPASMYGTPRAMTHPTLAASTGQPYGQQPYIPQVAPQASAVYGTSPAAQYLAATQAAGAGLAAGQQVAPGMGPQAGAGSFNQAPTAPYGVQGQPGMAGAGVPIPPNVASPAQAHSYPGAQGAQYGYNYSDDGDHFPHRRRKERKKKSRVRKILEDLLAGTALAALAEKVDQHHEHARRIDKEGRTENRSDNPSTNDPNLAADPATRYPPKGSALGFLHPKGHFVPSALDYMIEHFIRGNKARNLAPEGARPGYLHPGGHFVPMGMEGLIQEFKHTLLAGHERHGRHRGSSSSEYSDSEYSDESSISEGRRRRHRRL